MTSENDQESKLFDFKITKEFEFSRQRGTILTWKGKVEVDEDDTAVSFQDKDGVKDIWKNLCMIQGKEILDELYEDAEEEGSPILPEPKVENLEKIISEIKSDFLPTKYCRILDELGQDKGKYLRTLGSIMNTAEKEIKQLEELISISGEDNQLEPKSKLEEQYQILENLFNIFKNMIYIADKIMIEMLVDDEFFLITFGALEYDKESIKSKLYRRHRKFLTEQAKFNNLFNITNPQVIEKIHLNYRMLYLKDIAIGRFIEENTMKVINQQLYYNNIEITQYLIINKHIMKNVIEGIRSDDAQLKKDSIDFLYELNLITKDLMQSRMIFYETLVEIKYLDALEEVLSTKFKKASSIGSNNGKHLSLELKASESSLSNKESTVPIDDTLVLKTLHIFSSCFNVVPSLIKTFMMSKAQKDHEYKFINELFNVVMSFSPLGMKHEIIDLVKSILDIETFDKKTEFVDIFFNKILKKIVSFLSNTSSVTKGHENFYEINESRSLLLELLCFCFIVQSQKIKQWVIHHDLTQVILGLASQESKTLLIGVLKYIKNLFIFRDDGLEVTLLSNKLFSFLFEIFEKNESNNNMLFSIVLDMFEIIKRDNLKNVISFMFKDFYEILYNPKYKKYFSGLLVLYEKNLETVNCNLQEYNLIQEEKEKIKYFGLNKREITEREDEDYFNENDDEENENVNEEDLKNSFGKSQVHNTENLAKDKEKLNKIINEINTQHAQFLKKKKVNNGDGSDLESSFIREEVSDMSIDSNSNLDISAEIKEPDFKKTPTHQFKKRRTEDYKF